MFGCPVYGWVDLTLPKTFDFCASYLTNVLKDCFDAFERYLKESGVETIYFDGEGHELYLTICFAGCFIIHEDEYGNLFVERIDKKAEELIEEFIEDVERDLKDWFDFSKDFFQDDSYYKAFEIETKERIKGLKELLKKNDER